MQTIWTATRTQTPCSRCLAVALSSSMKGRGLEPAMRRYIQSLSSPRRTQQSSLTRSPSFPITTNTHTQQPTPPTKRHGSSASNSRWKQRQGSDSFAREAKVQGLKSRAAFKLLEMDARYKLFKKSSAQVVVDLGFAPGSWSQVALERTKPDGYVLGIDLIPAQPPKGVSTIQGNFLSPGVQGIVKQFLLEEEGRRKEEKVAARGGRKVDGYAAAVEAGRRGEGEEAAMVEGGEVKAAMVEGEVKGGKGERSVVVEQPSYIDMKQTAVRESDFESGRVDPVAAASGKREQTAVKDKKGLRLVDVVLSDMSAPWPQISGFSVNSLSNPYTRMMNTSGIPFRDHAGSMDLCKAALSFASDTLKPGGHFVCKFYQGGEDKAFENKLKKMFGKVHREKPDSSRSESKESFFVALKRKPNVAFEDIDRD